MYSPFFVFMASTKKQRRAKKKQKISQKRKEKLTRKGSGKISQKKQGKKQRKIKLIKNNKSLDISKEIDEALSIDRKNFSERMERIKEQRKNSRQQNETPKRIEENEQQNERDYATIGSIIYYQINELIDEYPTLGAKYLENLLKSEISKFGFDCVMYALANSDADLVTKAQNIVYYEDDSDYMHNALLHFSLLIRQSLPTEEEAKDLGIIQDSITSFNTYEE